MGEKCDSNGHINLSLRTISRDQRGAILLLTVLLMVVLILLAGIGVDLARIWVAREELQTAVDASSLAGSRHGVRHVRITVGYGHCTDCEDGCCCECDPPVVLTGTEKDLVERGGWRRGTCCDRFLGYEDRWIEFPGDTQAVAQSLLDVNWPQMMDTEGGGRKLGSNISVYGAGPYYPSVATRASGEIDTALLKLAGINELSTERCGQAGVFFDVIRNGWALGRNSAPQDACK